MGKFNKGDRFGGKKRFDGDRGGFRGGERSERPVMHDAVCSECGKDCQVPFRPTGDKPVFCSDCFGKKENSGGGRFERRDSGRPGFGSKPMFRAVCDKCHRDCEVPFRPTGDKPVFCSDCFGRSEKSSPAGAASTLDYRKQFEVLNNKLDSILKILAPKISAGKTAKEEKPVVVPSKKAFKKKGKLKKVAAPKKIKKAGKKFAAKKKK